MEENKIEVEDNQTPKPAKAKPNILLTEDDPLMSRMYQRKFTNEGYTVDLAGNGAETLAKLNAGSKPDLILLDIMMPKMNGFQFLEEFKKDPAHKDIPVIIITNLSDFEGKNRARGLELGAVDYIVKAHVALDDVVRRVDEVLGN